jgi:hypothetical protein
LSDKERSEDTISNKWTDLSHETISMLMQQGEQDAKEEIKNKPTPL